MCLPPASFIRSRIDALRSWPTSSPARSAASSDLRNHSRNAVTIAITAMLPSGIQVTFVAKLVRNSRIVRYKACPDRACPTSWPMTARISSSSRSPTRPVVSTMIGSSSSMHMAFGSGSCWTYISRTRSRSST